MIKKKYVTRQMNMEAVTEFIEKYRAIYPEIFSKRGNS